MEMHSASIVSESFSGPGYTGCCCSCSVVVVVVVVVASSRCFSLASCRLSDGGDSVAVVAIVVLLLLSGRSDVLSESTFSAGVAAIMYIKPGAVCVFEKRKGRRGGEVNAESRPRAYACWSY